MSLALRLIVLLLMGPLLAATLLGGCDRQKAGERQAAAQAAGQAVGAQGPVKGLSRGHAGEPLPDILIKDRQGTDSPLTKFKGGALLVNLWASWCVPCVKELPTLDALAAKKGSIRIVALSQDIGPMSSVAAFLDVHGIKTLTPYQDAAMAMTDKTGAAVLPTTILYDSTGREVWRYVGDRNWTRADAAKDLAEAK